MVTVLDYGKKLLANAIEPVAKRIEAFWVEARKWPGRRHLAVQYLEHVEPTVASLLSARVILDGIAQIRPVQWVAIEIGGRLEDEVRCRSFEEQAGGLFKAVQKNFDEGPWSYNRQRRRSTMVHAMRKFGVTWAKWPLNDRLHLGMKCVEPIRWTAPSGFLIEQAYAESRSRRVKTKVGDEIVFVSVMEDVKNKLDGRKQAQAIAPNFVHSMDAAALVLTITACLERGVLHMAAIHDSYGTLAAAMDTLQEALREQFVRMYEANDVLAQFASVAGARA
jgi:DNA-directed RNA polymerase